MVVGSIVEVKLSKDWVTIIGIDKNRALCRTKDYREILFYDFELREIK